MPAAYNIVFDQAIPGFDPFVNGKAAAQQFKALNGLCEKLRLFHLSSFLGQSAEEFADLFSNDFEEAAGGQENQNHRSDRSHYPPL